MSKPFRDPSLPPKLKPKPLDITWRCAARTCRASNYAHHPICHRCGAAKPVLFVEDR